MEPCLTHSSCTMAGCTQNHGDQRGSSPAGTGQIEAAKHKSGGFTRVNPVLSDASVTEWGAGATAPPVLIHCSVPLGSVQFIQLLAAHPTLQCP